MQHQLSKEGSEFEEKKLQGLGDLALQHKHCLLLLWLFLPRLVESAMREFAQENDAHQVSQQ